MVNMKWCKYCKDYYPRESFHDHMRQHNSEMNSDAIEHKQYFGSREKRQNDYMICVLHQKKVPCPVKDCHYQPFGMIRKSWMLECTRQGYFPTSTVTGDQTYVRINEKEKTVVLMGATIHLKI